MRRFVFDFDHDHGVNPKELKDLLGGKGANLAEMTSFLELPVPPGFTISTSACQQYFNGEVPVGLIREIQEAKLRLERNTGKILGSPSNPLLVSVRSGAKFSMPGMMDTVLNLGLNDHSVNGLAEQTQDQRFALDTYRRFISMFARIVLNADGAPFEVALEDVKSQHGYLNESSIGVDELLTLVRTYKDLVLDLTGSTFPQDPELQLFMSIEAVFASWAGPRAIAYREHEGISHELGTAVNVQSMVFGNRDNRSGTGVGFTRNPATGLKNAYGDFLVNAQGEDVVAGIRITQPLDDLEKDFPLIHDQLVEIFDRLERHFGDMCDTEFTIVQDRLWMLQTRVGK